MIKIRRANERGHANHGWLDSHHTFSFADYFDPEHMGFRSLRVINDDRVKGGNGFGAHPHRDMEIISYVLEGALAHKDSTGTGAVIKPGDVQRMSAGTGVVHSEQNASKTETVHFLQIWLLPEKRGIQPGYEQKTFSTADKQGTLRLVAARDAREGAVKIHTDASIYAGVFAAGESAELPIAAGRGAWVHVARGEVKVNGELVKDGDGVAFIDEDKIVVEGTTSGEVLVFDLA
jgi:redox-sensitive bicupin YhaK (pirin superfamily)